MSVLPKMIRVEKCPGLPYNLNILVFLFYSYVISLSLVSSFSFFHCTLFFPSSCSVLFHLFLFSINFSFSPLCFLLQEHLATSSSADSTFVSSIVYPFTPSRIPSISSALFLRSISSALFLRSLSFFFLIPTTSEFPNLLLFCSFTSFLISFTNISLTVAIQYLTESC